MTVGNARFCAKCGAPAEYAHYLRCKPCHKAYNAAYHAARKAKGTPLGRGHQNCAKCGREKGVGKKCKSCVSACNAAHREMNSERLKQKQSENYRANHAVRIARMAEYRANNRETMRRSSQNWYRNNREAALAAAAERFQKNKEAVYQRKKSWLERTAEIRKAKRTIYRAIKKEHIREWRKRHLQERMDYYIAKTAMRRAQKLKATPSWCDQQAIRIVYAEAHRVTKETGLPHDVDHIVPLQGKNVCGLHVHYNLRIIPAAENRSKHNRWEPDWASTHFAG